MSTILLAGGLALGLVRGTANAQATWEGPSGVFLNPLAFTLPKGEGEASVHFLDLQPAGSLTSAGVAYGITPHVEAGVTRTSLAAGGAHNTTLIHAKWQVVHDAKGVLPTVAAGAILRSAEAGQDTSDYYLAATSVFPAKVPVIASLTARSTDGLGSGLFGRASARTVRFGGVLAGVFAKGKVIAGVEYCEQPGVRAWQDLAVRWNVGPKTSLDAGYANLNKAFGNQVAVAISHKW